LNRSSIDLISYFFHISEWHPLQ